MQELDDSTLLREYVERDSGEAFATLVARHINKVYSVALRHTRNPHQAEEITQAVFVILARKSRHLDKRVILSGWLYETSRLTAVTFIRSEIRRARREQEAHMQNLLNQSEPDVWPQIAPLLDMAMAGLSETDRHAVVLRFFDGRTMSEVGAALGASEEAAKKRVSRAVEKLRGFFTKRGVVFPAAILTAAISANSVQAAPAVLAKSVTAVAITKGATASGSTLTLIKGALKLMAWTKAKTAIVVGVVILAAGSSTIVVHELKHKNAELPADAIKQFSETPNGGISLEAVYFLQSLKTNGLLPGIATNSPAGIEIPWFSHNTNGGTWHMVNTNLGNYPITLTLTVHANDVNDRYHYTITKASGTNGWQLQKAWCSDTNGIVLKQFPVP
jgi:RNA polymerase sigma factor (sigma-70 family)